MTRQCPEGPGAVLGFAESLMLMEGLDRVAAELRDRAAAGDASAQDALELADALGERLAQATSIELTRTLTGAP